MYNKTRATPFLLPWLAPFSRLYAGLLGLRHALYDRGLLRSWTTETPTVCVGNLSLGGTGKTPMVEYLLTLLDPGIKAAVLSRGYGRKTKGFLLAEQGMGPRELGDEPAQMYSNFPEVSLAVDGDRIAGVLELERRARPDLIVLDDAMQHRRIRPHYTLLLTDYSRLYTEDRLLPWGRLRDLKERAHIAQTVVVTKCPADLPDAARDELRRRLKLHETQELICCKLVYDTRARGASVERPLEEFTGERGALVTGIANPRPLEAFLTSRGIGFTHYHFPDHHNFSDRDVASFRQCPWLMTTQKDYMRLKDRKLPQLFYLGVRHQALWDGEERLRQILRDLLRVRPPVGR